MRFSLKALLIVVTGLALFCGYSHCRRQEILRKVNELETLSGGTVEVPNEWQDLLWQRHPTYSNIAECCNEYVRRCDELGIKEQHWSYTR